MPKGKKITKKQLEPLWLAGTPLSAISQAFGLSDSRISVLAKEWGFQSRTKGAAGSDSEDRPPPKMREHIPDHPAWTHDMQHMLAETRGNYLEIAELARRWEMTTRQVQTRYHLVVV